MNHGTPYRFVDYLVLVWIAGDAFERGLDAEQKILSQTGATMLVVIECIGKVGLGFRPD